MNIDNNVNNIVAYIKEINDIENINRIFREILANKKDKSYGKIEIYHKEGDIVQVFNNRRIIVE
jgi:hypothetical protein